MRKSDRVTVHHEKLLLGKGLPSERAMGLEFTIRRNDGVRVHHERKSDGVRVHDERKSDGVRVHHEKERWGESSP